MPLYQCAMSHPPVTFLDWGLVNNIIPYGYAQFHNCQVWIDYWLVVDLPLWKMMEFVSWDDEIPNIWKVIIHSCSKPPIRLSWIVILGLPSGHFGNEKSPNHRWFSHEKRHWLRGVSSYVWREGTMQLLGAFWEFPRFMKSAMCSIIYLNMNRNLWNHQTWWWFMVVLGSPREENSRVWNLGSWVGLWTPRDIYVHVSRVPTTYIKIKSKYLQVE